GGNDGSPATNRGDVATRVEKPARSAGGKGPLRINQEQRDLGSHERCDTDCAPSQTVPKRIPTARQPTPQRRPCRVVSGQISSPGSGTSDKVVARTSTSARTA